MDCFRLRSSSYGGHVVASLLAMTKEKILLSLRRTAATISPLPNLGGRQSIIVCRPNHGPSSKQGGGEWDKTSEVPEVHGASRWWALSKAVKPLFSKPSSRERARSPKPAVSMPELP